MSRRVVIIGGGFAGLSAGVALADRGLRVALLERRRFLGGRAYSFTDSETGDVVDNGQHLFIGAYHHTIAFLKKINRLDRLKFQSGARVEFLDTDRQHAVFACPPLPAPLHALAGVLRMRGLTMSDRLGVLRVGRALRGGNGSAAQTVEAWLAGLGQSERIRQRFWNPMVIATLNEEPAAASARMFQRVLSAMFDGGREATSMGLARVGLSDLYTDGARQFIEARGGEVRTNAEARRLIVENGKAKAIELRNGELIEAEHFISAVPPPAFLSLLPEEWRAAFAPVESLHSSPIVSINLWFDRPVTDAEFIGLLGTRLQWVFNKDRILESEKPSHQLAGVISAARQYVDWPKERLIEMALEELRDLLPAVRSARLVRGRVIKEREATIAHTLESDAARPPAQTPIENFILAGDWTATGLPATIESAVMSGDRAAELIREPAAT